MSGGSFNYLCRCNLSEALSNEHLDRAIDTLKQKTYSLQAAGELLSIAQEAERLSSRLSALEDVLQALEWWKSFDWSEDQLMKACEEWERSLASETDL